MKRYVIDTSALIRAYLRDGPEVEKVSSVLDAAARGECLLFAPELLLVEFASVLLKKQRQALLTKAEVKALMGDVCTLPLRLYPHAPLVGLALELASEHGLSAYDALFLALARLEKCPLLTADDRLALRARREGLH